MDDFLKITMIRIAKILVILRMSELQYLIEGTIFFYVFCLNFLMREEKAILDLLN